MKNTYIHTLTITLMILFLSSYSSAAEEKTCCFCETGSRPESQIPAFDLGCSMWLSKQSNCSASKTVPHGTDYSKMDLECKNGYMKIGYVGHWSGSHESRGYLRSTIVPLIKTHNVAVRVDNTACSSMNNPESVQNEIVHINSDKELTFRGNQAISIGEWNSVLPAQANFEATASNKLTSPQYPKCSKYENRGCLSQFQAGQSGDCLTDEGQLQRLTCCEQEYQIEDEKPAKKISTWIKGNCQEKPERQRARFRIGNTTYELMF